MRAAFKEWAVIVDALGRGDQIIILRKGGISEGRGGFQMEHERFLLFPTLFHQQRESVIPSAQSRFDAISTNFPPPDSLRLEFFAEVAFAKRLDSLADSNALRDQHVWRDEVIAERFEWGRDKSIFALAVRVFRLPQPITIPMREEYSGCKSWIELAQDVADTDARPVLTDAAFETRLERFRESLRIAAPQSQPVPTC